MSTAFIEVDKSWNPSHLIGDDEKFADSRTCSRITPTIYISGYELSCDMKYITHHGIKAVLHIGDNDKPKHVTDDYKKLGIKYLYINLLDNLGEDIKTHFEKIWDHIVIHRSQAKITLVNCSAGTSRAPAAVLYYLVRSAYDKVEKPTFPCTDELHKMLQNLRKCIDINPDFLNQIREFECSKRGIKFVPVKTKLDLDPVEKKSEVKA